jgi:signal transduction histidine kinase
MELRVSVTPIVISEKPLLIINIKDMSDSKRKNVLERLFFHDITNITSGLSAISELLESADNTEEIKELSCVMRMSASSLIDEIRSHKMIFEAENGELQVEPEKVSTMEILNDLRLLYSNSAVSIDKQIKISHESSDVEITTDRVIIKRVLGNLLKNALEAVRSGGNVMLSCKEVQDGVEFSVSNSGVIPRDIQLQLFHKNISTKGAGRGLGTHSVKLLTEKYLRGKVGFVSNEKTGTIFSVYYPFHI